MIVEKELAVQLDVFNPISIVINYEQNIKKKLEEGYVNKCYKNMLITKVKRITDYTLPVMSRSNIDGMAHIAIKFIAEGIEIANQDVIVDAVIKEINVKDIIIEKDKINGILQKIPYLASFAVGDTIPVAVDAVMYTVGKPNINIRCKVYAFTKRMRDIRKGGDYDKTYYTKLFDEIQSVKDTIKTYDTKLISTVIKLMQGGMNFSDSSIPNIPKETSDCITISKSAIDIEKIESQIDNKIISTHSINENLDYIITHKESIPDNNITVVNSDACIRLLLNDYLIFLKVLRDFVGLFKSQDINTYKKLWFLYHKVYSSTK
jgi:hypothetical protein